MSSLDNSRLEEVFQGLEDNLDKLTQWEQGFVMSVRDQWDRTGHLGEAQLDKLEKCWLKI